MGDLNNQLERLFKEIKEIKQNQKNLNDKMENIQKAIEHIGNDMYSDEGFDFEIVCPYCENEFVINMDENKTEVKCPECNNIIELDWSGNLDENEKDYQCGCNGCTGCKKIDEDDDM